MSTLNLDIVIKAVDQFSKNVDSMFSGFEKKFENATNASQQFAAGLAAAGVAVGGFAAYALKQAGDAQAAQERLTLLLRNATGATDQQIGSLMKQASALERVGVVSAGNIIIGQSQLATFDLQAASIEKLTPAILDYVVAEKGAAASADDMIQMTNGLAQALNGNFGSLTRTGFVLDETTKELIANGTEAEKVAAIVDVLNSTYEGFNSMARGTLLGSIQVLKNNFDGLAETIGLMLLPLIQPLINAANTAMEAFIDWVESMGGAEQIMENLGNWMKENEGIIWAVAGAVSGGLALAFAAAAIAAGKFMLAITPALAIGASLGAAAFAAKTAWDENFLGIQDITQRTATVIEQLRDRTDVAMKGVADALTPASNAFQQFYDDNKETIDLFTSNVLESFLESFNSVVESIKGLLDTLTEEYGETFNEIWKTISFWWDQVSRLFGEAEGETNNTFKNILAVITQVFDTIVSVVTTKLDIMLKMITIPLQAMQGIVRTVMAIMRGDVEGAMSIMSDTVARVMNTIKSIFTSIWDAITSAINGALDVIVGILRGSGEEWAQTLASYIERFRQIGGDLVRGLINGITGMASQAVGAVRNMASNMISSATAIFDSHSPSRVFMGIGFDVVDGLRLGLEENATTPVSAIEEMTRQMVEMAMTGADGMEEFKNLTIESLKQAYEGGKVEFESMYELFARYSENVEEVKKSTEDLQREGVKYISDLSREFDKNISDVERKLSGLENTLERIFGDFETESERNRKRLAGEVVANEQRQMEAVTKLIEEKSALQTRLAELDLETEKKIGQAKTDEAKTRAEMESEEKRQRLIRESEERQRILNETLIREEAEYHKYRDRIKEIESEVTETRRWNALSRLDQAFEAFDKEQAKIVELRDEKLKALDMEVDQLREVMPEIQGMWAERTEKIQQYLGEELRKNEHFRGSIINSANAVKDLIDALDRLQARQASMGIMNVGVGRIPALAQGGIVTKPTVALIGEGGESEAVIPLSKMKNMGGGPSITITGNTFTDRYSFEKLVDEVIVQKLQKSLVAS